MGLLAAIFQVAAATGVLYLSYLEHRRSIRPSNLIIVFLMASTTCDLLGLLYPGPWEPCASIHPVSAALVISQDALKVLLLAIESLGKESALYPQYRSLPCEETTGIIQRTFFWWINSLLARGANTLLHSSDLPGTPQKLSSTALRQALTRTWDERCLCSPSVPAICLIPGH